MRENKKKQGTKIGKNISEIKRDLRRGKKQKAIKQ